MTQQPDARRATQARTGGSYEPSDAQPIARSRAMTPRSSGKASGCPMSASGSPLPMTGTIGERWSSGRYARVNPGIASARPRVKSASTAIGPWFDSPSGDSAAVSANATSAWSRIAWSDSAGSLVTVATLGERRRFLVAEGGIVRIEQEGIGTGEFADEGGVAMDRLEAADRLHLAFGHHFGDDLVDP